MKKSFPGRVEIQEVVLRDGIQNERKIVPTQAKIDLIERLISCGVRRIEVSSFVNPRLVPQMADAEDLWSGIARHEETLFSALILSRGGLERAARCGVRRVGIFVSASETHSMRNSRRTVRDALAEAVQLIAEAKADGISVRAGVMNAFGCAYEGLVPEEKVAEICRALCGAGPDELCLADTSGLADPRRIRAMIPRIRKIKKRQGAGTDPELSLHLHNTRDRGLANLFAAIEEGVVLFDTSLGGLGGCPFIEGARGNIATEDTVSMLHDMGIATGIDLDRMIQVSLDFEALLGKPFPAMVPHLGRC
jgi:hydroxymethylglutaryl-CoA lyase